MLPVRCFTCNNLIGHMWEGYLKSRQCDTLSSKERLDRTGLTKICCRRMLLTHVDVINDTIDYGNEDTVMDECGTTLRRFVDSTRDVECT